MMKRTWVFPCLLVIACGGSDFGDDPGTGSATLRVDANIEASSELLNATDAADFVTRFEVVVRDAADSIVAPALVNIGSSAGAVELVLEGDVYRGSQTGYYRSYILNVEVGAEAADFVQDVRLTGPDIHVFSAPSVGEVVASDVDLAVEWNRDQTAEIAQIETRETNSFHIDDTGNYMMPCAALLRDSQEVMEERIRLSRESRIVPAGTLPGSSFEITVVNRIEFLVNPNPAL